MRPWEKEVSPSHAANVSTIFGCTVREAPRSRYYFAKESAIAAALAVPIISGQTLWILCRQERLRGWGEEHGVFSRQIRGRSCLGAVMVCTWGQKATTQFLVGCSSPPLPTAQSCSRDCVRQYAEAGVADVGCNLTAFKSFWGGMSG